MLHLPRFEPPFTGINGYGEAFFLAKAGSYNNWLAQNGVDPGRVATTLAAGYGLLSDDRGDTLYVLPGDHAVTASLTWAKSNAHLVGLGGPNQRLASTTPATSVTRLKCVTAQVAQILLVTGHHVQLHGLQTFNNGNHATNYYDICVRGKNFYAEECSFRGGNNAAQLGAAAGIPVALDTSQAASDANLATFKSCTLGSSGNSARTVSAASLIFKGGGSRGAFGTKFIECTFEGRIEQSDALASLIWAELSSLDRYAYFKQCLFYNFWTNHAGLLDFAVVDAETATHDFIFDKCALVNIDALCNVATHAWTIGANSQSDGGKAIAVDTTP